MMRRSVTTFIVGLSLTAMACGNDSSPTEPTTTTPFLAFTSTPGDLIGRGRSDRIDLTRVTVAGGMSDNNRFMNVTILGVPNLQPIGLTMSAARGQRLAPGVYPNARFGADGVSLSFSIAGSACESTGQFEVLDAAFGPINAANGNSSSIQRLHATFRQSCVSSASDTISGEVWLVNTPVLVRPTAR